MLHRHGRVHVLWLLSVDVCCWRGSVILLLGIERGFGIYIRCIDSRCLAPWTYGAEKNTTTQLFQDAFVTLRS